MKGLQENAAIKNIVRIGLGLIGGSFVKSVKQSDKSLHVEKSITILNLKCG
ncbi:MAG TPA: hypothetical protein VK870_01875 [Ignavibacteriaceae bacterium]|nr:hypothetical protein [Ignavibacteriaceae bacterium]